MGRTHPSWVAAVPFCQRAPCGAGLAGVVRGCGGGGDAPVPRLRRHLLLHALLRRRQRPRVQLRQGHHLGVGRRRHGGGVGGAVAARRAARRRCRRRRAAPSVAGRPRGRARRRRCRARSGRCAGGRLLPRQRRRGCRRRRGHVDGGGDGGGRGAAGGVARRAAGAVAAGGLPLLLRRALRRPLLLPLLVPARLLLLDNRSAQKAHTWWWCCAQHHWSPPPGTRRAAGKLPAPPGMSRVPDRVPHLPFTNARLDDLLLLHALLLPLLVRPEAQELRQAVMASSRQRSVGQGGGAGGAVASTQRHCTPTTASCSQARVRAWTYPGAVAWELAERAGRHAGARGLHLRREQGSATRHRSLRCAACPVRARL